VRHALREALRAFRRAPVLNALSVTTIAFSLFAFGLFALVALNLANALQQVEDRIEIRAFIAVGTHPEASGAAVGDIALFPEVLSVQLVTEAEALERARRELTEFADVFEIGLLPASIEVRLHPGQRDPETVRGIAEKLERYDFVDDVRFGEEWVENLARLRRILTGAGLALGSTFALVAMIIIGSTIRMEVLARRREIAIMRLVGATDRYIRAPFLVEGLLKGIVGGLLALLLTWVALGVVDRWVIEVAYFDAPLAVGGVVAGAVIGIAASALSVGRHLKQI
jgi:cell division transport system permease protein